MALPANFDTYLERLTTPFDRMYITKSAFTVVAGRTSSLWTAVGGVPATGVAPTTAAVPTEATTGALPIRDTATNRHILRVIAKWGCIVGGTLVICDRLAHSGGLSGTVTGAQTTNLPSAALTRYTSGVNVMGALEIYTAIGATATTFTTSYTDTGIPGHTSPATVIGGTGFNAAGRFIDIPILGSGTGIKEVASVNLVASTLTAGNFGVTLYKPLLTLPMRYAQDQVRDQDALLALTGFANVEDNACLFMLASCNTTSTGVIQAEIHVTED